MIDPAPLLDRPPEEVLPVLARAYLRSFGDPAMQRMVRLFIGEAVRRPEVAGMIAEQGPGRVLDFLKSYLARQVEAGRLRPHDVRAGARAFLGMLIPQIVGPILSPTFPTDGLTDEEHLNTVIAIFLRGLCPEE